MLSKREAFRGVGALVRERRTACTPDRGSSVVVAVGNTSVLRSPDTPTDDAVAAVVVVIGNGAVRGTRFR